MKLRLNALSCAAVAGMLILPVVAAEAPEKSGSATPVSGKSYQIQNKQYGQLLRPEEANSADGTPIVLFPAQPWKCMTWKLRSAGESQFCLQNHFTSKTFAASVRHGESGTPVTQVPLGKQSDNSPGWQFTKLEDGTFKIVDGKTGKALTAQRSPTGSGVKVAVQAWLDSDAQKWNLQEIDPGKLTM